MTKFIAWTSKLTASSRACSRTFGYYSDLAIRAAGLIARGDFKRVKQALRAHVISSSRRIAKPEPFTLSTQEDLMPAGERPPLVSVVIPCFNYGRFIAQAVDSVLAQTLVDVEIIIVEGGSTDIETVEIVRSLCLPRTRVFFQSQAQLVGANRNSGIASARGRYVCCLDADDTIDPTYLEKAVYFLESYRYDVVSTGIKFTGSRQGTIDVLELPTLGDMTQGNHVTTCGVFRRELWQMVGGYFDTGKDQDHVAEDWDFWLRITATGARIRNIVGEHLFNYRIHPGGSLSSSIGIKALDHQRIAIIERNKHLLTQAALQKSAIEANRQLVAQIPGGRLTIRQSRGADVRRSLLIAVPFLIIGGAERLLASIVRHLVTQGWHVTIISTLPQDGHRSTAPWFTPYSNEIYMLPQFLSNSAERKNFVRYLLRSRKFDVVLIAGSLMAYELLPEISKNYPELAVVDLLFNTVGHIHSHSKYQKQITFAIAENPEVINWYRHRGWPPNKVRMIESGIDVACFKQKRPASLVSQLKIRDQDVVIGFSGRLSQEKAPEVFLEIAAAFCDEPRARFVMTGAGPLRDSIKSQLATLPKGTRIDFLGQVESTIDFFALYDIFVLPSRRDGRPLALLEALASGCAVVASRVGGVPALIEGREAGILCSPGNTAEFVENIRELLADTNRLNAAKQNAFDTARNLFSETQMVKNYVDALETAIAIKTQTSPKPSRHNNNQAPAILHQAPRN
jgi:glycosyltransferase involved in cell wall biosynthesis